MNPFSGFLQPSYQPLDMSPVNNALGQMDRRAQFEQEMKQRQLENTQHNATSNAYLKLQQDQQARKFGKDDQAEQEGLLAEYAQAVSRGDAQGISDAVQKLQRYGMDVKQANQSAVPANLGDFNGGQAMPPPLPGSALPDVSQFTGQSPKDLSQGDFEEQLINGSQAAASSGEEPDIAGHLASVGPLRPLKLNTREEQDASGAVDLGDVDSPEFQKAAATETPTDLGDVDSPQFQADARREMGQEPPRLATQALPNVSISKDGKQLYAGGAAGRWQPMVAGVFEPFMSHESPAVASAAKQAQQYSQRLIAVDGVEPKEAIAMGMKYLEAEANRATNLERTKIGSRPRGGGGVGGGLMGKTQDIAESAQLYDDNARAEAAKIQEEDRQYESIEAAANSGDPALQRDAVNQLLKIRSGTAVTAAEDARISQINGLVAQVQDRLGRWTGGAMTPDMARTIQQIVSLKRQVSQAKIRRIYEHQAKLYLVQNQGKTKDPKVLEERARVLREGGNAGATSEEDLY